MQLPARRVVRGTYRVSFNLHTDPLPHLSSTRGNRQLGSPQLGYPIEVLPRGLFFFLELSPPPPVQSVLGRFGGLPTIQPEVTVVHS